MIMWLAAAIGFFIIEAIIPGLISLWFGIAAVLTMLCSPFIENVIYEFYVFIILSGITFFITKNISAKWRGRRKDNVDRIRGSIVKVRGINDTEEKQYDIYLDGKNWTGRCDELLEIGEEAEVVDIEGIKLILKKIHKN